MSGLNDVEDIPRAWRAALARIQTAIPQAVIAGGCLRDREFGVAVKDIDIFVPSASNSFADLEAVEKICKDFGWKDVEILNDKSYPRGVGVDVSIIGVVAARAENCPPIEIIVGDWDTQDLVRHFDFGICQIVFNGSEIIRSPNYQDDRRRRLFRVCTPRSDMAFVQTINRWARLKQKYPNWTFDLGTRSTAGWRDILTVGGYYSGGSVTGRSQFTSHPNMQQVPKPKAVAPSGTVHRTVRGMMDDPAVVTRYQADIPLAQEIAHKVASASIGAPDRHGQVVVEISHVADRIKAAQLAYAYLKRVGVPIV